MIEPNQPANEEARLKALHSYNVLDTLPEKIYDDITAIASQICESPISLVSLIDENRQWFKSNRGLGEVRETERKYAYCAHAINEPDTILEVEDAYLDERFRDNPLATGEPFVRFYAGAPLVDKNGHALGTLCVIDHIPKKLNDKQREALMALSRQVMAILELRKENFAREAMEAEFSDLLENLGDGVFELDEFGTCVYANATMLQMLAARSEQVVGQNIWPFIHPDDAPKMRKFYGEQFKNQVGECSYEYRIKTFNGEDRWIEHKTTMTYEGKRMTSLRSIARDRSEHFRLKSELATKDTLYQLVSENSSDLIAIHELNGVYKYISPSIKEILGYDPEELIGTNPYDLMHESDIERLQKGPHQSTLQGQSIRDVVYRLKKKSGEYVWMESYTKPIFNEQGETISFQTSSRDITERQREKDQILRYKEGLTILNELASMVQSIEVLIPNALKVLSEYLGMSFASLESVNGNQCNIIYQYANNEKACYSQSTFELGQCYGVIPYSNDSVVLIYDIDVLEYATEEFYRLHGYRAYVGAVVRVNGKKYGTVNFFNSDAKTEMIGAYEGEFMQLLANWFGSLIENDLSHQSLLVAKNEAEAASKAKASFLSMMSHEIRTPLNGIIGTTHLLLNKNPRVDQTEHLRMLKISGDSLLTLVNDILDFNKIEEGKLTLENTDFNLREVVETIHANYEMLGQEKSVEVLLEWDPSLNEHYVGDQVRIGQVLHNLVNNAVKFTDVGEVIIHVEQLNVHDDFDEIQFMVEDTGIGIHQDKISTIFDNFMQADLSTTRKFGGSGLGLAITKRLLLLMDSEVEVLSKPDEGSIFSFSLVLRRVGPISESSKPPTNFEPLHGTILLVEDNLFNRTIAKEFLESWGCEVIEAENGQEALDILSNHHVDLVLLDLQMPIMDGYETIRRIRWTSTEYMDIKVIALTASALGDVKEKVFRAGMNGLITKPFHPREFYKKIAEYLVSDKERSSTPSRKKLENLVGKDEEMIEKFMSIFIKSIEEDFPAFEQAIQAQNFELIRQLAHKNKSSLKTIGYDHLALKAEQLEEMILNTNPETMVISRATTYLNDLKELTSQLANQPWKTN